jgi:hypothetical protein
MMQPTIVTTRFDSAANVLLQELRQRRAELRAELERVESAIATVASLTSGTEPESEKPRVLARGAHDMTYAEAVESILMQSDRQPASTKVLLRRLEAVGKPVKGRDPYRILYRSLMKNPKFENVGGQWALAEWYPSELTILAAPKE